MTITPQKLRELERSYPANLGSLEKERWIRRSREALKDAADYIDHAGVSHDAMVDKIEGLEADLRLAVQVAYNRGAQEWARLNYPQWIEWLEASAP